MDSTGKSYFAAAGGPTALTADLAELEALHQMLKRPKNNAMIPATGAAQYWYVDPRLQQRAVLPEAEQQPEGIGLLPKNYPTMLLRKTLGVAPRLAGNDRKELLDDIEGTFYGGGQAPAPTPTPTPQTRMMPVSFFT